MLNYIIIKDSHSDKRKIRIKLYRHIKRIESTRFKRKIVEFYGNRSKARTEIIKWIAAFMEDVKTVGITQKDI